MSKLPLRDRLVVLTRPEGRGADWKTALVDAGDGTTRPHARTLFEQGGLGADFFGDANRVVDPLDKLLDALAEAKRITNFEGKRRQMQFIGKQMRLLSPEALQSVREALDIQRLGSAKDTQALHLAEAWRDRLIADDAAVGEWIAHYPQTDIQQLRALVRQARKDAVPVTNANVSQGLAPRQSRAYREMFKLVRSILTGGESDETPDETEDE